MEKHERPQRKAYDNVGRFCFRLISSIFNQTVNDKQKNVQNTEINYYFSKRRTLECEIKIFAKTR